MTKLFNFMVLVALALTIVLWFIPVFDERFLSDEALKLLSANGWGSFIPNPSFIYWPQLIFWIVISIGLVLRIKAARFIYFLGIIFLAVVNFGWGFLVYSPLEAGLANLINLLDGGILIMAYFTSVNNEFASPNKTN